LLAVAAAVLAELLAVQAVALVVLKLEHLFLCLHHLQ
jgi:hypothetical protein